ncbi:MAG: hypothetical protein G01um101472_616 [Parcubacteria group bacterium Gr01-1014_72]|nr:MAG: hypothetical protein G01um101472_616 [Parcubacteria group bacterium Gr01-1014_72]
MNVLMVSSDAEILREGSASWERHRAYAGLFEELHIIVFTKRSKIQNPKSETNLNIKIQISKNAWVYPLNTSTKVGVFLKTIHLGKKIISSVSSFKFQVSRWVVTAQNPFELGLIAWIISRLTGARLHLQIHTDFLSPYFARHSLRNRFRTLLARFLLPPSQKVSAI